MKTFEWYDVNVEFEIESDNGKIKTVKENYLVNALSPTEAESKFYKFAEEKQFHDFKVKKAVEKKYIDVISE